MIKMMVPVSSEANYTELLKNPQVWGKGVLKKPSELDRSFRTLGSRFVGHLVFQVEDDAEQATKAINELVDIWSHLGFKTLSPFDFRFVKLS